MTVDPDPGALAQRLHELDRQIEQLRKRIYAVQVGLASVANREETLAELDREYRALGDQFTETYRQWQAQERQAE